VHALVRLADEAEVTSLDLALMDVRSQASTVVTLEVTVDDVVDGVEA
jgi:hypothetical protein